MSQNVNGDQSMGHSSLVGASSSSTSVATIDREWRCKKEVSILLENHNGKITITKYQQKWSEKENKWKQTKLKNDQKILNSRRIFRGPWWDPIFRFRKTFKELAHCRYSLEMDYKQKCFPRRGFEPKTKSFWAERLGTAPLDHLCWKKHWISKSKSANSAQNLETGKAPEDSRHPFRSWKFGKHHHFRCSFEWHLSRFDIPRPTKNLP